AQSALQTLPRVKEVRFQRLELQFPQQILLVGLRERLEQFRIVIEVVLDGTFAASGDEQDLLDPVGNQFFHDILHDRFARDRQHFLGLRLGSRQQAGSQTRNGNDCALNHLLNIPKSGRCYIGQRKSEWRISRNNSPPFASESRAWIASTPTPPRRRVRRSALRCDPTGSSSRNCSLAKSSPRPSASTSKPRSFGNATAATAASTSPILPNCPKTCSTRSPPARWLTRIPPAGPSSIPRPPASPAAPAPTPSSSASAPSMPPASACASFSCAITARKRRSCIASPSTSRSSTCS